MNAEMQTTELVLNHKEATARISCLDARSYKSRPDFSTFCGKKTMPGTEK